jgi:hypothetical protein
VGFTAAVSGTDEERDELGVQAGQSAMPSRRAPRKSGERAGMGT